MTAKRFQLLAIDVTAGAGFVRTPKGELIVIYPSAPEGVPMTELEMETSITHPGFPYGFEDLREKGLFFISIVEVRKELKRNRVYPVHKPLIPRWDAQRSLMWFATNQQLEQLLNRAFHEFIPTRKFTSALRVAEGMQYAKNANLTLSAMTANVARDVLDATDTTLEHKNVARRTLALWREKLICMLTNPDLHSWQEICQFLEIAKEDDFKELLEQIEKSRDFSEEVLELHHYISSVIKDRAKKMDDEELLRETERILEKVSGCSRVNDFIKRYEDGSAQNQPTPVKYGVYTYIGAKSQPEPKEVAV